jgi:tetratricopeptide (TPR) repeat protein
MRCRFLLAAVAAAVIVAEGVSSPRPAVAAGPQPAKRASAAENFEYATHHLTRGQWFERAAGQLRAAARSEPDNGRYRLALGCALASRAASLAYTATFVQAADAYRRSYPERLAAWEAAKKEWDARLTPSPDDPDGKYDEGDPRDPGERPEPPPPLLLRTKDDNQRFRLTPAQAKARVAALAAEAKAEWEKAEALAATPDERAEAQHVRGWGLWLLARNEKNFLTGLDGKDDGESATAANLRAKVPDEVRALLQAATEAAPENARYWQALGDALLPDRVKAEKAYRRVLELDPANSALWQRLYLWKGEKHTPPAEGEETPTVTFDPKAAIDDLKRAAQADPLNAFPLYLLAGVKLRETDYGLVIGSPNLRGDAAVDAVAAKVTDAQRGAFREALEFIERGNRAPRYEPLRYRPRRARSARRRVGVSELARRDNQRRWLPLFLGLRELARAASGYALVAAKEGHTADAVRACQAVIGIGERIAGDWPLKDDLQSNKTIINTLVGIAVTAVGYNSLERVYVAAGNVAGAEQTAAEYAAFKQRHQAYTAAWRERQKSPKPYGMLGELLEHY